MTGTVEINLGGKRLILSYNNYSVGVMRKQLLRLAPQATIEALARDKKISQEQAASRIIQDILDESEMTALQALIYAGLWGTRGPKMQLPEMTIEEVGEALAGLSPEEINGMFDEVYKAKQEADGPPVKKKADSPSRKKKS